MLRIIAQTAGIAGLIAAGLLLAGCGDETQPEVTEQVGETIAQAGEPTADNEVVVADPPAPLPDPRPPAGPDNPVDRPPADAVPAEPAADVAEVPDPAIGGNIAALDPVADGPADGEGANVIGDEGRLEAFATEDPILQPEMGLLLANADADAGRSYAQRCTGCHSFQAGPPGPAAPQVGPSLFGIVDRRIGAVEGFDYSPALNVLRTADATWTLGRLNAFLSDMDGTVPGTAMTMRDIEAPEDRADVIAFLQTLALAPGQNPGAIGDPALVARIEDADPAEGEALAERCVACHFFGEGEEDLVGPNLFGLVGATVGRVEGFAYSLAFRALSDNEAIWTYNRLDAFLESPPIAIPGTRMGFAGMSDENERAAIIAYLAALSPRPTAEEFAATIGVVQPGLSPLTFSITEVQLGAVFFAMAGCDECHGGNLRGRFDFLGAGVKSRIPALVGPEFQENWFGLTVYDLFDYVRKHQPGNDDEIFPIIIAHILGRNGFTPGRIRLPSDREAQQAMGFYQ